MLGYADLVGTTLCRSFTDDEEDSQLARQRDQLGGRAHVSRWRLETVTALPGVIGRRLARRSEIGGMAIYSRDVTCTSASRRARHMPFMSPD